MANPNLQTDLKQDWVNNEIVMPADVNEWAERINNLNEVIPIYAATGNFYTATYSNNVYNLQPCSFEDNTQNVTPSSYIDGMSVCFKIPETNLAQCKININNLGEKYIKLIDNTNVPSNYFNLNEYTLLKYDAENDCFYVDNNNCSNRDLSNLTSAGQAKLDAKANISLNNLDATGNAKFNNKASIDLDNLSLAGLEVIKQNSGAGMPVGTIYSHTCSADFVPENSLPCNGTEYSKTQFPTLWTDWLVGAKLNTCTYEEYASEISTYGKCGKFGVDTASGKFKVPTISDGTVIQSAMTDDELGKPYNAGLPNITGKFSPSDGVDTTSSGAFYDSKTKGYGEGAGQANKPFGSHDYYFDASRSNPIYGNSDTVQPNAVALRYFVVVATGSINQSEMDWSAWASSLGGKLNADHSNDTKPYITESYVSKDGTSGYNLYSNKMCEQWGTVTSRDITVTLLKPYKDVNFNVSVTALFEQLGHDYETITIKVSNSQIRIYCDYGGTWNGIGADWRTIGYIA